MKITITIEGGNERCLDIQVDDGQRIKTTLRVLGEHIEEFHSFLNIEEVQIKESGRRIKVDATYEEAMIYTGSQIVVKEEGYHGA